METCCGYGYGLARDSRVSVGFSRVGGSAPDTARAAVLYGNPVSLSPGEPIPGIGSLTKKRELFPGPSPTSPTSFALPHATLAGQSPCPGSGILTRLPFDGIRATTFCFFSAFCVFRSRHCPRFRILLEFADCTSTQYEITRYVYMTLAFFGKPYKNYYYEISTRVCKKGLSLGLGSIHSLATMMSDMSSKQANVYNIT